MRLKSYEGWNFDRLGDLAGEYYNPIGNTNLYVSDLFTRGNLHLQVIKHKCGRVVGLINHQSYDKTILITLGEWSSQLSYNLYAFAKREEMYIAPAFILSEQSIDILQGGLKDPCEIYTENTIGAHEKKREEN